MSLPCRWHRSASSRRRPGSRPAPSRSTRSLDRRTTRTVGQLNDEWAAFSTSNAASDAASDADKSEAADAAAAFRTTLRDRRRSAEGTFEGSATDVVGLLNRGPQALSDPAVAGLINGALQQTKSGGADSLRVLTLNIGGGAANSHGNEEGFDRGDVSALATRILKGDADVANLQEVFQGDASALEQELEDRTGENWTLTFSQASNKLQFGSGFWTDGAGSFGNAILVRAPDNGHSGSTEVSVVDDMERDLTSPSYFGLFGGDGGDGGDGRSMAAVTVETENGERVTIGTAQTDWEKDVDPDDQAQQLTDLRDNTEQFADETGGDHVVLTGDLNHELNEHTPSGETLRSWQEDYQNAGDSANAGHSNGNEIDYIWTSNGLESDDVDRVPGDHPDIPGDIHDDRDMSDHNGIALDLTLPGTGDYESNDPSADQPPGELPHWDDLPHDPVPGEEQPEPSPSPNPSPTPSGG